MQKYFNDMPGQPLPFSFLFFAILLNVTESVKTQHNCANLNLQYKALNTISEAVYH